MLYKKVKTYTTPNHKFTVSETKQLINNKGHRPTKIKHTYIMTIPLHTAVYKSVEYTFSYNKTSQVFIFILQTKWVHPLSCF